MFRHMMMCRLCISCENVQSEQVKHMAFAPHGSKHRVSGSFVVNIPALAPARKQHVKQTSESPTSRISRHVSRPHSGVLNMFPDLNSVSKCAPVFPTTTLPNKTCRKMFDQVQMLPCLFLIQELSGTPFCYPIGFVSQSSHIVQLSYFQVIIIVTCIIPFVKCFSISPYLSLLVEGKTKV